MSTGAQPAEYYASENAPASRAAYAYIIHHEDGTAQFFTSWDVPFSITNLPAAYTSADPQEFTPAQISHEPVRITDKFEMRSTMMSLPSGDEHLRRYLTTAAAVRLEAWILRINSQRLASGELIDFTRHCVVVENGLLTEMGFNASRIAVKLVPAVFSGDRSVPRFYYNRTCNHALFSAGCGLVKADHAWVTSIVSVDPVQREIVVTGQHGSDTDGTRFSDGHFLHDATGFNFTISWAAFDGANTKFKLWNWHPAIAAAGTLTAYPGCRHTREACTTKFSNQANFGGFPHIPNSNPVTNGVTTG